MIELARTGSNRKFLMDDGTIKTVPFIGPDLPLATRKMEKPEPIFPRL